MADPRREFIISTIVGSFAAPFEKVRPDRHTLHLAYKRACLQMRKPSRLQDQYATHLAQDTTGAIDVFLNDSSVNILQVRIP